MAKALNENTRSTQLNPDIPNSIRYLEGKCPTIQRMSNIDINRLKGHWFWYWTLYPYQYECAHTFYLVNKDTLYNTVEFGFLRNK